MTVTRMDNVGIVVEDIDAAIGFFTELGLELEGRVPVEGDWADGVTGLRDMRVEIAMMRTPDCHSRLELSRFLAPPVIADHRTAPVNALGYLRVMFAVDDIDDTLARLGQRGATLVGELVRYQDMYRLCYIRGPEGILIGLAQPLRNEPVAEALAASPRWQEREVKNDGLHDQAQSRPSAVKAERLDSVDDPDWLSLRTELWPDCPRQQHLEEMAGFLREPTRFVQFVGRSDREGGVGLAEASIRSDYVNGTSSSPVAFFEGLYGRPEVRGRGIARSLVQAVSEWAVSRGCIEFASDTQLENLASQAVHGRLGFVETERAVFFRKPLDSGNAT